MFRPFRIPKVRVDHKLREKRITTREKLAAIEQSGGLPPTIPPPGSGWWASFWWGKANWFGTRWWGREGIEILPGIDGWWWRAHWWVNQWFASNWWASGLGSVPLPPPLTVPKPPTRLTATVTGIVNIVLNWSPPGGQTGFTIQRSLDGVTFSTVGSVAGSVTGFIDSDLAQSVTYYYQVIARNAIGNSQPSNIASATTGSTAPPPPPPPPPPTFIFQDAFSGPDAPNLGPNWQIPYRQPRPWSVNTFQVESHTATAPCPPPSGFNLFWDQVAGTSAGDGVVSADVTLNTSSWAGVFIRLDDSSRMYLLRLNAVGTLSLDLVQVQLNEAPIQSVVNVLGALGSDLTLGSTTNQNLSLQVVGSGLQTSFVVRRNGTPVISVVGAPLPFLLSPGGAGIIAEGCGASIDNFILAASTTVSSPPPPPPFDANYLVTESGIYIVTEAGDNIVVE
jgi:hypothetical protein